MKFKVGQTIWGLACTSPKGESKLDLSPTYIAEMTKRKLLCRNSRLGIFGWVWKKDLNITWFFHKKKGIAWLEANAYRKLSDYQCNSERWVKEVEEGE